VSLYSNVLTTDTGNIEHLKKKYESIEQEEMEGGVKKSQSRRTGRVEIEKLFRK